MSSMRMCYHRGERHHFLVCSKHRCRFHWCMLQRNKHVYSTFFFLWIHVFTYQSIPRNRKLKCSFFCPQPIRLIGTSHTHANLNFLFFFHNHFCDVGYVPSLIFLTFTWRLKLGWHDIVIISNCYISNDVILLNYFQPLKIRGPCI